jgi:hypothetical protein
MRFEMGRPIFKRNGELGLQRGASLMPTEAVPRDFRLAAIKALISVAVNSTSVAS